MSRTKEYQRQLHKTIVEPFHKVSRYIQPSNKQETFSASHEVDITSRPYRQATRLSIAEYQRKPRLRPPLWDIIQISVPTCNLLRYPQAGPMAFAAWGRHQVSKWFRLTRGKIKSIESVWMRELLSIYLHLRRRLDCTMYKTNRANKQVKSDVDKYHDLSRRGEQFNNRNYREAWWYQRSPTNVISINSSPI